MDHRNTIHKMLSISPCLVGPPLRPALHTRKCMCMSEPRPSCRKLDLRSAYGTVHTQERPVKFRLMPHASPQPARASHAIGASTASALALQ
jgi:hypothetical protein